MWPVIFVTNHSLEPSASARKLLFTLEESSLYCAIKHLLVLESNAVHFLQLGGHKRLSIWHSEDEIQQSSVFIQKVTIIIWYDSMHIRP